MVQGENLATLNSVSDDIVFIVRSNSELSDALQMTKTLNGGAVIKLVASDDPYQISSRNLGSADAPVLITAADPDRPPVVDKISLSSASHVTISGLDLRGKAVGEASGSQKMITIAGSDHVVVSDNTMTGVADGFRIEGGTMTHGNTVMLIRDSSDITVADNTIAHFGGGIGLLEVDGLIIRNNDISHLQGDGIQGGGLRNVVISDNNFHDFYGTTQSLTHSDMIQIWGSNAKTLTANIEITRNVLDAGNGALSQGIFIRNELIGRGDAEINGRFQNITITDNLIHNGAPHGIAVGDTDGVVVQSNTLLLAKTSYMYRADGESIPPTAPHVVINNSANITATDNLGSKFFGQIDAAQNYMLNYGNAADAMFVDRHIVNLSGAGDTDLRDLQIRADSPLWGTAGAALSSQEQAAEEIHAVIASSFVAGNAMARTLDASQSTMPDGSTVSWHLEDGQVLTGVTLEHVFASVGAQEVQVIIRDASGHEESLTRIVEIEDPFLFAFDFSDGLQDSSNRNVKAIVKGDPALMLVETPEDQGFHLTAGTGLSLSRGNTQLWGLDEFEINLRFRQDAADGKGGLLGIHSVMQLEIRSDGGLTFKLTTDDGTFRIHTDAKVMQNTDWHDISVRYDGAEGTLSILVDGDVMASGNATGVTKGDVPWPLGLGRAWGENAQGVFESVSMNRAFTSASAAPADPDTSDTAPADTPPESDNDGGAVTEPAPTPVVPEDEPVQEEMHAVIASSSVAGNAMARTLDASESTMPDGSTVSWHLEDGQVLTGVTLDHVFASVGAQEVEVIIRDASGHEESLTQIVEIEDPFLFAFDFSDGLQDSSNRNVKAIVKGDPALMLVETPEDQGFHLTADTGLSLSRGNTQLWGLDEFEIDLTFRQDAADGKGGLLGIHSVMQLDIRSDGGLTFKLTTDDGTFRIHTDAKVMQNTDWHDIGVRYDGAEGTLSIVVDGDVMASGNATGVTKGNVPWPLGLGRPWGENAQGVFESVSMNRAFTPALPADPDASDMDYDHDSDSFHFAVTEPALTPVVPEDAPVQDLPAIAAQSGAQDGYGDFSGLDALADLSLDATLSLADTGHIWS